METTELSNLDSESRRKGYFVVLEGIDGSGKTTICQNMIGSLHNLRVTYCSKKEIAKEPPFVENRMRNIAATVWPPKADVVYSHLLPPHYWIFTQAAWYSLVSKFVIASRLEQEQILMVDGWYYKFLVKLLAEGHELKYLETIFSHVLQPDLVILLDIDVSSVWERKNDFYTYEMGSHSGNNYPTLGKESFIDHQEHLSTLFKKLAQLYNWTIVPIGAYDPIELNVDKISKAIDRNLKVNY